MRSFVALYTNGVRSKTTLHNFTGGSDGEFPNGNALVLDSAGILCGFLQFRPACALRGCDLSTGGGGHSALGFRFAFRGALCPSRFLR